MYSAWFTSIFLRALKFLEIKERGPNFWGEPILQNVWIIWFPLLYFNLKSSMHPNSSSFIRFESILHESGRLFSESWYFYKLKRQELISAGNQFFKRSELFAPPLLCFNFKSFLDPNCSSLNRFQCILNVSRVLLSGFSNFYKLKWGYLIFAQNQLCRMSGLFGPPFCI